MKKLTKIKLTTEQKDALSRLVKGRNTAQKVVLRAKIILAYADGKKQETVADKLVTNRRTVGKWLRRYNEGGIESIIKDSPRKGRIPKITDEKEKEIIDKTLQTKPKGATHWTTRTLASHSGVSKMTIQRLWKKYNLKPHIVKNFKISNDKNFVEKLRDVVGLYLNPPEKAVVISVDEKSQIQALDRTQPSLPMKKGRTGTMTHDYKRNGTTTLFAAMNILNGKVIGECYPRHTHKEFLKFLKKIDKEVPKDLDLHIIMDNYATHKKDEVNQWLKKHPRFKFHFIPTSSSWLNLIERFFGEITNKMIRRGVFKSVPHLIKSIEEFLEIHNENPKVFTWTKDADTIIEKVHRAREALNKSQNKIGYIG
jgi:transposase